MMKTAKFANSTLVMLLLAMQGSAQDPHRGEFTEGTGRPCASCHAKNPRAEDTYRAAARMETMTNGLSRGLLARYGGITCFTCHRAGGPGHLYAHPAPLNRSAVRAMLSQWPANAKSTTETIRLAMNEYSVSLGVTCEFCHTPTDWASEMKPPMKTTRVMETVMKEFPKYFDFANASAFTCFTCHQGATKVPRKTGIR
jgi:hypothetical protein